MSRSSSGSSMNDDADGCGTALPGIDSISCEQELSWRARLMNGLYQLLVRYRRLSITKRMAFRGNRIRLQVKSVAALRLGRQRIF